ncbi:MAG: 4a-hydroxytetrahydrobiopterin dehydratase [archaeon]|jgi:4a-hydroxytetrahydrobiopterin dehydratase
MSELVLMKCEHDERRLFVLDEDEIEAHLQMLWGWSIVDDKLTKEFSFPDFVSGLVFANKIAKIAEQENHHPKICLEWGKVEISLYTHSVEGITKNDFILAAKIDELIQNKS